MLSLLFSGFAAKVLQCLNEKQISHMDLKPANILLKSADRPILKVAGTFDRATEMLE